MSSLSPLMKTLIGRRALVEGKEVEIIDWLAASETFALQEKGGNIPDFQENQYGQSGRRVHRTWTLSCLNEARSALHPVIRSFMKVRELQQAEKLIQTL